jgi:hypothetical protein
MRTLSAMSAALFARRGVLRWGQDVPLGFRPGSVFGFAGILRE